MKKLGIGLLVLLVLVIGADRVADVAAQQLVADSLADSQRLDDDPDVDITGFPFLTQLAAGSFDRVDVSLDAVPVGDLTLTTLDLQFEDVSREGGTVRAERGRGEGVISFDDLSELLGGARLAYVDGETIAASVSVPVGGTTVEASGTIKPALANRALDFGQVALDSGLDLSGAAAAAVEELLGLDLALSGIPFSVAVESLAVKRDGIHLALSGQDLSYSS